MTDKEIILLFNDRRYKIPLFKKYKVKELCIIMDYLKKNIQTKNENWSINLFKDFCVENNIGRYTFYKRLNMFYNQYSKRKKENKQLFNFLKKVNKLILKSENNSLKLANKNEIKSLLKELGDIKRKYLIGDDNILIKMISENIETNYSQSTLRNYYYSKN